ncbi:hypothetical protein [Algihabitans albus]|uniref:hypothetical protein n=1 Tax=Algihabitans albus TaxID=2164067 RepID=UPI000E5CBAEB|nr:hypothetical protein [Algihabitans albus]
MLWLVAVATTSALTYWLVLKHSVSVFRGAGFLVDNARLSAVLLWVNIAVAGAALALPSSVRAMLSRLGSWPLLLVSAGAVAGWFVYDTVPLRRVLFMNATLVGVTPFIRELIAFACGKTQRLARGLAILLLVILIVPGFVLPPFWDGIPGWTAKHPSIGSEVAVAGYQLIRDDGAAVWYTPAIVGPVTYFAAWRRHSVAQGKIAEYDDFLWRRYVEGFDLLATGRPPNQRYLGPWAHPSHTPWQMYDYATFPPERIDRLAYVVERYDLKSGQLFERTVLRSHEVWP